MERLERFKKAVEYLKLKAEEATNEGVSRLLRYNAENYISDVIGESKPINKQLLKRMVEFSINPEWIETGKGKMIFGYQPVEAPLSMVNEDPAEYNRTLPLGNLKITVQDYIDELRIDKKKLQNTIDTNLTAMIQLLSALSRHDRAFHETMLKSLARLEKRQENDLVGEARSFEASKQLEEQTGDR